MWTLTAAIAMCGGVVLVALWMFHEPAPKPLLTIILDARSMKQLAAGEYLDFGTFRLVMSDDALQQLQREAA